MAAAPGSNADYNRPIRIADGVYWVGSADVQGGVYCNPYLIVDGDEAVLIDGGGRPDFSTVMMKIMQAGIAPTAISTLIYQHFDPDLCGSIAHFVEIINRPDLRIVSKRENNLFIRAYGVKSLPICIDDLGRKLVLASGRTLHFIPTPYAHAAGSFMTFDPKSAILFTSDLLGGFEAGKARQLLCELPDECLNCRGDLPALGAPCAKTNAPCAVRGIVDFHREEMSSSRALQLACRSILSVPAHLFAPQHGSVWPRRADVEHLAGRLMELNDVGIDHVGDAEHLWH